MDRYAVYRSVEFHVGRSAVRDGLTVARLLAVLGEAIAEPVDGMTVELEGGRITTLPEPQGCGFFSDLVVRQPVRCILEAPGEATALRESARVLLALAGEAVAPAANGSGSARVVVPPKATSATLISAATSATLISAAAQPGPAVAGAPGLHGAGRLLQVGGRAAPSGAAPRR